MCAVFICGSLSIEGYVGFRGSVTFLDRYGDQNSDISGIVEKKMSRVHVCSAVFRHYIFLPSNLPSRKITI